jgi:proteasome lid subunit RPN8/RPN11
LMVNTRRRLIRVEQVSQGLLDTILVHPREVFNSAIAARAAAIVLVHNHPSGDPTPSEADIKVTRDLIRAGQLLKIEVLDHVILGCATVDRLKDYSSLRELGYFADRAMKMIPEWWGVKLASLGRAASGEGTRLAGLDKRAALPPLPPLRTGRETFASSVRQLLPARFSSDRPPRQVSLLFSRRCFACLSIEHG